jgi:hypothetical protein
MNQALLPSKRRQSSTLAEEAFSSPRTFFADGCFEERCDWFFNGALRTNLKAIRQARVA